jgi:hypothetical protein
MAVTYDPDDQVQLPDFGETYSFELPPKTYLHCDFGSDAAWENCLCLTRTQPLPNVTLQKSQYSIIPPSHPTYAPRNLAPFAYFNYDDRAHIYVVSGWHKQGGPSGGLPWIQSKKHLDQIGGLTYVRFEDASDEDFNDIWAEIRIG